MFGDYHNLLVPVDGSEQSEFSFKKAVAIAKRNQAKLHIIYVDDTRNIAISPEYIPLSYLSDDTIDSSFVNEMMEFGEKEGVEIEKIVTRGNPLTVIATTFPEKLGTDLIVIGATGKGAVTRALVGSVSNHVVRNAKCDVLVVRQ